MKRILVTGDTHGVLNISKIENLQKSTNKLDYSDYLIICGDCGVVWDKSTLDEAISVFENFGTNILFVDGNHENFDILNNYPVSTWNGGKIHKISEHIYHLIRGEIFNIFNKTFLAVGGANSTDKHSREEHVSWWESEQFDYSDLYHALDNLKKYNYSVDYVISHSPNNDFIQKIRELFTQCGEEIPYYLQSKLKESESSVNLQSLANEIKFKKWFCGHIHIDEKIGKYCVLYNNIIELK